MIEDYHGYVIWLERVLGLISVKSLILVIVSPKNNIGKNEGGNQK